MLWSYFLNTPFFYPGALLSSFSSTVSYISAHVRTSQLFIRMDSYNKGRLQFPWNYPISEGKPRCNFIAQVHTRKLRCEFYKITPYASGNCPTNCCVMKRHPFCYKSRPVGLKSPVCNALKRSMGAKWNNINICMFYLDTVITNKC